MNGAPMPADGDAEWSFLCACYLEPELVGEYAGQLPDEAFHGRAQREVWRAMKAVYGRGDAPDPVSVTDHLREAGRLEKIGGEVTVARMVDAAATAANAETHAEILRDKLIRRRVIAVGREAAHKAHDAGAGEARQVLDWAETELGALAHQAAPSGYSAMSDVVWTVMEDVDRASNSDEATTGLPTGFSELDDMTDGFHDGELIVLAGRPGMGKSAFALDIARHIGLDRDMPVGLFSLEMGEKMVTLRLVCAEAALAPARVRAGDVANEREWSELSEAATRVHGSDVLIDDTASLSVLELRSRARRMARREDIGLLVVDYLQLMAGPSGADTREQEVASISRGLKAIARELDVPVLALSQLNRSLEHRSDKRPHLADLRESGAIEQDADVVLFVHRPEVFFGDRDDDGRDLRGKAEIIVGKQRNGPLGTVPLRFDHQTVSFRTDVSDHYRRGGAA